MEEFIKNYRSISLLTTNASLQLVPENHGKNIRFELFAAEVVGNLNTDRPLPDYHKLRKEIDRCLRQHPYEDPPERFFTENIMFFNGNFIVFPGISNDGTEILNWLLNSIFLSKTDYPKEFKDEIEGGVTLILTWCDQMAKAAGLKRNVFVQSANRKVTFPKRDFHKELVDRVVLQETELHDLCAKLSIPISIIEHFVVDNNDPKLDLDSVHSDIESNPLLNRPLVKVEDYYVFSLPTTEVTCLTEFILSRARAFSCLKELMTTYHEAAWLELRKHFSHIGWAETNIELPSTTLPIKERMIKFDNDKLAYVCYLAPNNLKIENEEELEKEKSKTELIHERTDSVFNFLNEKGIKEHKFLTLFILGHLGGPMFFTYQKPLPGNGVLAFNTYDLLKILQDDDTEMLTLWKFWKSLDRLNAGVETMPGTSLIDMFVIHKKNDGTLFPIDDAVPNFMMFTSGNAGDYRRDVITKLDEHNAQTFEGGSVGHTRVIRYRDFAPLYIATNYRSKFLFLTESYNFPVWISFQKIKGEQNDIAKNYCESVAFWMFRLTEGLGPFLSELEGYPLDIELKLGSRLLQTFIDVEFKDINPEDLVFKSSTEPPQKLIIQIPDEFLIGLNRNDNAAERELMRSILKALSDFIESYDQPPFKEHIQKLIDNHIPLGSAKMILPIPASLDWRLDPRWLLLRRYLQEAETSRLLESLAGLFEKPIPAELESADDKYKLCSQIVEKLVARVKQRLPEFDNEALLTLLMNFHEYSIQSREFSEILIPAKIACYSSYEVELNKLLARSNRSVATSLSLRLLIEFIAAEPPKGGKRPSLDEIDELLALVREISTWGQIGDSIRLGLDNPRMGLLPSGRIGVNRDFFEEKVKTFHAAKMSQDLDSHIEGFEDKFWKEEPAESKLDENREKLRREINQAFSSDYGIEFEKLLGILTQLSSMAYEDETSVLKLSHEDLLINLAKKAPEENKESIQLCLQLITLIERGDINTTPPGFTNQDTFLWRYNRPLSYLRRPLVPLRDGRGKEYYLISLRHMIDARENLIYLVMNGKLQTKKGGSLEVVMGKINKRKGGNFRESAMLWLNKQSGLKVIEHEVEISEKGHLKAEKHLGDIDILAFDPRKRIAYLIECKRTQPAKIVYEMKTEMDKYLGRDGSNGEIKMHVVRHEWANRNMQELSKFLDKEGAVAKVSSIILTSEELPIIYLSKEKLPLPFISFSRLKRDGIKALANL